MILKAVEALISVDLMERLNQLQLSPGNYLHGLTVTTTAESTVSFLTAREEAKRCTVANRRFVFYIT